MNIEVKEFYSLDSIYNDWKKISNKISPNSYILSYDIELLKEIYLIIKPYVSDLKILVIYDNSELIGILPFYHLKNPCLVDFSEKVNEIDYFILGEGIITDFRPLLDLKYLNKIKNILPPYISFEWSHQIYDTSEEVPYKLYKIIKIKKIDEYFLDLSSKVNKNFTKILKKNSDIIIKYTNLPITDPKYQNLLKEYKNYRNNRETEDSDKFPVWMKEFVSSNIYLSETEKILKFAYKNNVCHTLEFYLNDELVAVNFATSCDNTISDYLTLRKITPELNKRSLGIFAILSNLQYAYHKNFSFYDMGTPEFNDNFNYKNQFYNHYIKIPYITNLSLFQIYYNNMNKINIFPATYKNNYISYDDSIHILEKMSKSEYADLSNFYLSCGPFSDILVSKIA